MRQLKHLASIFCLLLAVLFMVPGVHASGIPANLLMRLSTRTGPGTQYDEPRTYFQNDWRTTQVQVISAAKDNNNEAWWVQVDFTTAIGTRVRAYTELKRVNVDIDTVFHEQPLGDGEMTSTAKAYWGPGREYKESKFNVPNATKVTVYGAENGFVQVEFYDARTAKSDRSLRRAWVAEKAVGGNWISPVTSAPPATPAVSLAPTTTPGAKVFFFCPSCGKQLPGSGSYAFCPYCGASLSGGTQKTAPVINSADIPKKPWAGEGISVSLFSTLGERLRPQCGPGYDYKTFRAVAKDGSPLYQRGGFWDIKALFTVKDWVYVSFIYSDSLPRMGFFEKYLFNLDPSVPEISLAAAKTGIARQAITPHNGPGTQYGEFSSCRVKAGDVVYIYFEERGWVYCEFFTTGNDYGNVQLWLPKSKLNIL